MNSTLPRLFAIAVVAGTLGSLPAPAGASQALSEQTTVPLGGLTFTDAQKLFYNGRYRAAAVLTLALRSSDPEDLASYELRTSALLFELKYALGEQADKEKAFERCLECPDLIAAFLSDTARGQLGSCVLRNLASCRFSGNVSASLRATSVASIVFRSRSCISQSAKAASA